MSFNGAGQLGPDWWSQNSPWEEWYAWHPVKDIHGERHWLKKIYRRYSWVKSTEQPFGKEYDYGTLFDVLAQDQEKDDHFSTIIAGTMLFDYNTHQFKIYTGTSWVAVADYATAQSFAQSYVNAAANATSATTK